MIRLKNFKKKAIKVTATVTHVEKYVGLRCSKHYWVTLEYKMPDTEQVWNANEKLFQKIQTGDKIPLWYLADKPTKFTTESRKSYHNAIAITGVFFLLIVWFCYWLSNLEYTQTYKVLETL